MKKGDRVRVVRGRKVPIGTEGTIFWTGESDFGLRLGIKDDPQDNDEEPTWVAAKNCDVVGANAANANGNGHKPEAAPVPQAVHPGVFERLQALQVERDTLARHKADADRETKSLIVERDALKEEVAALKQASKAALSTGISRETIEQAIVNVTHALRFSLGAEALKPIAAPKPERNGNAQTFARPVITPEAPKPEAPKFTPEELERAKREAVGWIPERLRPASTVLIPPPAPAPAATGGLKRCTKCQRFILGAHTCPEGGK